MLTLIVGQITFSTVSEELQITPWMHDSIFLIFLLEVFGFRDKPLLFSPKMGLGDKGQRY